MSKRIYTDEQLVQAVKKATSYRDVARILGFKKTASHLPKEIKKLELDTSHFSKSTKKGKTKYDDWLNTKHGKLTIIEILPPKENGTWNHSYRFHCECECGKFRTYPTSYFKRGLSLSCGCDKSFYNKTSGENNSRYKGYKEISGSYWSSICYRVQHECKITIKKIWNLFLKQERKCALTGLDICFGKNQTASLDRIDSSKGYIEGNVQWVHKTVNRLKNNYNQDEFLSWCKLIIEYKYGIKI